MISDRCGSNMYSVPPMKWCPSPARPRDQRVQTSETAQSACHPGKDERTLQPQAKPISTLPISQKKRKFCAPYCRQYSGAQTISQMVHPILSQSGRRCMAAIVCDGHGTGYAGQLQCKKQPFSWRVFAIQKRHKIRLLRITSVTCWSLRLYLRWLWYGLPSSSLLSR